jgi:hypothetical protein
MYRPGETGGESIPTTRRSPPHHYFLAIDIVGSRTWEGCLVNLLLMEMELTYRKLEARKQ